MHGLAAQRNVSRPGRGGQVPVSGPLLFARYAFPPNQHGYCGPADAAGYFTAGVAGDDQRLRARAREFDGAYPFLEVIAASAGDADPLDLAVVEAYWVGGPLLARVDPSRVRVAPPGARIRSGPLFADLADGLRAGGLPHHSLTVFGLYPWIGLLGDQRRGAQALHVLDRCRIRWGQVHAVDGDRVEVVSRPLTFAGGALGYGPAQAEYASRAIDGSSLVATAQPGDWVSLHWDWVCDVLTDERLGWLQQATDRQLELANRSLGP